jgi:hypothetical protein
MKSFAIHVAGGHVARMEEMNSYTFFGQPYGKRSVGCHYRTFLELGVDGRVILKWSLGK